MSDQPPIVHTVSMRQDGPASEIQLADLKRFVEHCESTGVSPTAAIWAPGADGRDQRVHELSVRTGAGSFGYCVFQASPVPGMNIYSCNSWAKHRMMVPIRDSGTNQAGAQVQRNFHGEGVEVRVCEQHARTLKDKYGAVYADLKEAGDKLRSLGEQARQAADGGPRGRYIGLDKAGADQGAQDSSAAPITP